MRTANRTRSPQKGGERDVFAHKRLTIRASHTITSIPALNGAWVLL